MYEEVEEFIENEPESQTEEVFTLSEEQLVRNCLDEAENAIVDAEDAIDEAQENGHKTKDVEIAERFLKDANNLLTEAESAYDRGNLELAKAKSISAKNKGRMIERMFVRR